MPQRNTGLLCSALAGWIVPLFVSLGRPRVRSPRHFFQPERILGREARMTRIGKGKVMQDTVGIDVSKATLDAYWLSGKQHLVFSNDLAGLKRLVRWICKAKADLTVFEATGVYDRLLQAQLASHGLPFSRVNPKQARRFAEGIGQLAKTDKVDAILLARMGSLLDLKAETPRAQSTNDLKDLATARQALIRDRTAAKARTQTASVLLLKAQLSRRLKQIERDLVLVDAAHLRVISQA